LVIFVVLAITVAVTFHPKAAIEAQHESVQGAPNRRSPAPFNVSAM
jgi:hypothetical protein